MNRVSVLQQIYLEQKRSTVKQHNETKNEYCQSKYSSFFIWMVIGILIGSIPLAVIVIVRVRSGSRTAGNSLVDNTRNKLIMKLHN
jgi:hypothetical protein